MNASAPLTNPPAKSALEKPFLFGKIFGWALFAVGVLGTVCFEIQDAVRGERGPTVGMSVSPAIFLVVTLPLAVLGFGLARRHRWAIWLNWPIVFALFIATVQNAEPGQDGWKIALPSFVVWLVVSIYYWRHR